MPQARAEPEKQVGEASEMLGTIGSSERRRLSGPGFRTFLAVSDSWQLTEAERLRLLGSPTCSTYRCWAEAAREHREITLDLDTLFRLSAVLGVYEAVRTLFPTVNDGLVWLREPHQEAFFNGLSPLQLLTSGSLDAILAVGRFLGAARGGIYAAPNGVDVEFRPYRDEDIVIS